MKTLILSVGGSIEPIKYSLLQHKPDFALFFCSRDSAEEIAKIKADIGSQFPDSDKVITPDHQDINACISAVKEALPKFADRLKGKTIVDITGGTKAMAAALLFGSSGKGYSYSYVGGFARDAYGKVLNAAMRIFEFNDPADVFKDSEKKLITELFNLYRFDAVGEVIRSLPLSPSDEDIFNGIGSLSEGYSFWEKFEHAQARQHIEKGIKKLETYCRYTNKQPIDLSIARKNASFLEMLSKQKGKVSSYHLVDLFCNALRRMEEGKYDDCVARLYSCIEHIGKKALADRGIDDSNAQKEKIIPALREQFAKKYTDEKGKIKLPLAAKFKLLSELGDEKGGLFAKHEADFTNIMASRNASVLAHGTSPVKKEVCEKFLAFVEKLVPVERAVFPKARWV